VSARGFSADGTPGSLAYGGAAAGRGGSGGGGGAAFFSRRQAQLLEEQQRRQLADAITTAGFASGAGALPGGAFPSLPQLQPHAASGAPGGQFDLAAASQGLGGLLYGGPDAAAPAPPPFGAAAPPAWGEPPPQRRAPEPLSSPFASALPGAAPLAGLGFDPQLGAGGALGGPGGLGGPYGFGDLSGMGAGGAAGHPSMLNCLQRVGVGSARLLRLVGCSWNARRPALPPACTLQSACFDR
jgi:hypothetical protein